MAKRPDISILLLESAFHRLKALARENNAPFQSAAIAIQLPGRPHDDQFELCRRQPFGNKGL